MEPLFFEYGSTDDHLAGIAAELNAEEESAKQERASKWNLRNTDQVMNEPYIAPLTLVAGLQLAAGRPFGVVGVPGSGKNDFAQAIALAVVSGKDCFNRFPVTRRGRVIHVSYDLGDFSTRIRYRRLANGMGLTPADVGDRLTLSPYPVINLSAPNARKEFTQLLHGYDLCVLDNLRAATPGIDENSSMFGERIATFGAACEGAGCVGLFLHHTRKASREAEEAVTLESLRGTSAIAGASGAIWYITPTDGIDSPRFVKMLRTHDTLPEVCEDFYLHHAKCNSAPTFDAADLPPIKLIASDDANAIIENGDAALHQRILAALKNGGANVTELRTQLACQHEELKQGLEMLLSVGSIICHRAGRNSQVYSLTAKV